MLCTALLLSSTLAITPAQQVDVNRDGDLSASAETAVVMEYEAGGPAVDGRIDPYSETIPNDCGTDCACGLGPYHACTDNRYAGIICLFDTSGLVGQTATLHWTTGITPYGSQWVYERVYADGSLIYSDDWYGCPGPIAKTATFTITGATTEIRFANEYTSQYNWYIVGTDDCDPSTSEAYLMVDACDLTLTLSGTPSQVNRGEVASWSGTIANPCTGDLTFDGATMTITGPANLNKSLYSGPPITVPASGSLTATVSQPVPLAAPVGLYHVEITIFRGGDAIASDGFDVTVN